MTATTPDLAEIEQRAAAATPGPWRARVAGLGSIVVEAELPCINGLNVWFPIVYPWGAEPNDQILCNGIDHEANAAFLAAARTDIQTLLSLVRAERARADAAEQCAAQCTEAVRVLHGALASVVALAKEAHREWDRDNDPRVGKILMALSGYVPGYRQDTDAVHAALAHPAVQAVLAEQKGSQSCE